MAGLPTALRGLVLVCLLVSVPLVTADSASSSVQQNMDPSMNLPDPRGFRAEGSSKAFEYDRSGPGIMSIQVTPGSGFIVQPWVADGGSTADGAGPAPSPPPPSPPPPLPPVRVSITTRDASQRYSISDEIYGSNMFGAGSAQELKAAGVSLVRKGGNAESRFNWAVDATNRGADWYFEVKPDNMTGGISSVDAFVQGNKDNSMASIATVPMLDWLPRSQRGCSYSVAKYGKQLRVAPDNPDCGNGRDPRGRLIKNDPADTNVPSNASYQRAWIQTLVQKYGQGGAGGVKYYSLDNEPVWWSHNHVDVHPAASTYDEVVARGVLYAQAVKQADPSALVTGPVTAGWEDVFYSLKDMEHGWSSKKNGGFWSNPVDRNAHRGKPFLQYYLEKMAAYQKLSGQRLLDVVDVHAHLSTFGDETDPATQASRVNMTRALWDPTFQCPECPWLDPVNAPNGIPRFLQRVKWFIHKAYPGTPLAITEYGFGGRSDASGAVAQAEVLGIFGLMNVTLAAVFPGITPNSTVYHAFKMYRNYDGHGGSFGTVGVRARSSNRQAISAYAAINRPKRTLTVLVINLTPDTRKVSVDLLDFAPARPIVVYRYDTSNLGAIRRLPNIEPASSVWQLYPGYSLTMLEIPIAH